MDLSTAVIRIVFVWELLECAIKNEFQRLNCRSGDFGVIHFAFGNDIGISKIIDRCLSQRFDGRLGIFAAYYGDFPQCEFKRMVECSDATDKTLSVIIRHPVISPRQ